MAEKKIQQYKLDAVTTLKEMFEGANDYIFTNYRGLTVEQITELRNKLREKQAEYKVVKNRFAKIALNQLEKAEGLAELLTGPTAVALSHDETGPVAKILLDFGKEAPVAIKGALIDDQVFDTGQVEEFSKLPTKDELIAKLMGTMNAPIQHLAFALNGVPEKLVRTLQAVADQKAAS
jgi:large subunit ribosomal protein L10